MVCYVCGGTIFQRSEVLWPELIAEWSLAPEEVAYINRQQGEACVDCGANLRSNVLAKALCSAMGADGVLQAAVSVFSGSILEINEAGTLHPVLATAQNLVCGLYPDVDMQALPYPDERFDIVVHSDTLEHVPHPIRGLAECRRVLRPGGTLCYTVPTIVGRLSRRRDGLPPSYHGAPGDGREDHLVYSEYGADMWTEVIRAGFESVQILANSFPCALAIVARK